MSHTKRVSVAICNPIFVHLYNHHIQYIYMNNSFIILWVKIVWSFDQIFIIIYELWIVFVELINSFMLSYSLRSFHILQFVKNVKIECFEVISYYNFVKNVKIECFEVISFYNCYNAIVKVEVIIYYHVFPSYHLIILSYQSIHYVGYTCSLCTIYILTMPRFDPPQVAVRFGSNAPGSFPWMEKAGL
jgi:hypothetical protein